MNRTALFALFFFFAPIQIIGCDLERIFLFDEECVEESIHQKEKPAKKNKKYRSPIKLAKKTLQKDLYQEWKAVCIKVTQKKIGTPSPAARPQKTKTITTNKILGEEKITQITCHGKKQGMRWMAYHKNQILPYYEALFLNGTLVSCIKRRAKNNKTKTIEYEALKPGDRKYATRKLFQNGVTTNLPLLRKKKLFPRKRFSSSTTYEPDKTRPIPICYPTLSYNPF